MQKELDTDTGLRYSKDKAKIHLIPPEIILALAEHFTKGALKYEERNWEKGMNWDECYNSLMRHSLAWQSGEDRDKENNTHHMIAVMWNAAALYWYYIKNKGKDTRVKLNSISHWGLHE